MNSTITRLRAPRASTTSLLRSALALARVRLPPPLLSPMSTHLFLFSYLSAPPARTVSLGTNPRIATWLAANGMSNLILAGTPLAPTSSQPPATSPQPPAGPAPQPSPQTQPEPSPQPSTPGPSPQPGPVTPGPSPQPGPVTPGPGTPGPGPVTPGPGPVTPGPGPVTPGPGPVDPPTDPNSIDVEAGSLTSSYFLSSFCDKSALLILGPI